MEQNPAEYIHKLAAQRDSLPDDAILEELTSLPVLPDEDDPVWLDKDHACWEHAALFLALAEVAARRKLSAAIPLLLERASYGDPFEMMRGLRHRLEAIVHPEWHILADACTVALTYPQAGARLWAVRELGVLRNAGTLKAIIEALDDEAERVRMAACQSLQMLCQVHEGCRRPAIEALTKFLDGQRTPAEQGAGYEALVRIEEEERPI